MRAREIESYARLLVERSVGVQPGWQVLVRSTPLARPLVEAVQSEIARRGAYPILQLGWDLVGGAFVREAPLEVLEVPAPLLRQAWEQCDAFITIAAPENTRDGADITPERQRALRIRSEPLRRRHMAMAVPWVICEFPTNAGAQNAGLSLADYEEFVYGAVLLDWDAERERMAHIAALFDAASSVRIVGAGTELTFSLAGRAGVIDDGHINLPGGEVFYSPVEGSVEGEVTFSEFPALYLGHEVVGASLRFRAGSIVEATAASGEEFLRRTLDCDEGARRIGEFGIGCNPGISRFTANLGFDEKIDGTIHLAVGSSYGATGGTNESQIHWDLVKDLRAGGEVHLDGKLVQRDGVWIN